MNTASLISLFFAGAFLCNSIPHLASGLQGRPFPTPFATPRGVGDSSPLINVYWGALNLILGLVIVMRHPLAFDISPGPVALTAGALALGTYLAVHFGTVQAKKSTR